MGVRAYPHGPFGSSGGRLLAGLRLRGDVDGVLPAEHARQLGRKLEEDLRLRADRRRADRAPRRRARRGGEERRELLRERAGVDGGGGRLRALGHVGARLALLLRRALGRLDLAAGGELLLQVGDLRVLLAELLVEPRDLLATVDRLHLPLVRLVPTVEEADDRDDRADDGGDRARPAVTAGAGGRADVRSSGRGSGSAHSHSPPGWLSCPALSPRCQWPRGRLVDGKLSHIKVKPRFTQAANFSGSPGKTQLNNFCKERHLSS